MDEFFDLSKEYKYPCLVRRIPGIYDITITCPGMRIGNSFSFLIDRLGS